ncbi:mediator of RNA polymerase II transcription subunit 8 isoform X2 [Cryptomeria japonica]|uniref:mediator of RNA polymerase II transcription subunit 8 isoform X2 n=1 Tax=Cryptomeria japonica TaxID=3369 RepID=UPI0027DA8C0C|nr:mediator of RNA polymerase II transcription subunit 8 isoform X2 [Cryptomeria japonica]
MGGAAPQLNAGLQQQLQQQLNLEDVRNRAMDLFKAITRIREQLEGNANVKWQDVLSQFSVVNVSLVKIVDDIKKVSKAFVIYPKNVNQENSTKLPVMLSSKLLPEMELEETSRRQQILQGISSLPVQIQVEKLKSRIDAIATACNNAEKCISEARKVYGLGARHNPGIIPQLDKLQATKIDEQEKLLRSAVNSGEGLWLPVDQRSPPTVLPPHLELGVAPGDGETSFPEAIGNVYPRNPPSSLSSTAVINTGAPQLVSSVQPSGRSAPSPMTATGGVSTDNRAASPMQYTNSPSPQQQQRPKMPHTLQQSQPYSSQQLRAPSAYANAQTHIPPSQEQQNQLQAKFQQERQPYHSFTNRQFSSGSAQQHGIAQNTQGSQSKHHLASAGNLANIYGGNQNFATSQMYNVPAGYPRNVSSQVFPESGYNVGASGGSQISSNLGASQQHVRQASYNAFSNPQLAQQNPSITNIPLGNLTQNTLHGQPNYGIAPNSTQNPNYGQQRQPPPQ